MWDKHPHFQGSKTVTETPLSCKLQYRYHMSETESLKRTNKNQADAVCATVQVDDKLDSMTMCVQLHNHYIQYKEMEK